MFRQVEMVGRKFNREEKFRFAKTGAKDHSRFLNRKDGKNARS